MSGKVLPFADFSKRDALVVAHLYLVAPIARHLAAKLPPCFEMDDLIAAGNLGLIDAASKWKADRGVAFAVYAKFRIKGDMRSSIRRHQWHNGTMGGLEPWHSEIRDPASEPDAIVHTRQVRKLLESALELLPVREAVVIETKYLKNSDLNQAASKLHLCPSRASQLHVKGLEKLKQSSRLRSLIRVA